MKINKKLLRVRHAVLNQFLQPNRHAIIVLGNQKSGTSVIAHLLADIGGLSKMIDIPPLWPPVGSDIILGKRRFADVVQANKSYFATALFKEPIMTFFADEVIETFPMARYVFVMRDPRDNIRSLLNSRHIPGNLAEIEPAMIPAPPAVTLRSDLWGGADENYIAVLAHRWNKATEAYLRHRDNMTLIRYEDFMADKSGAIHQLAQQVNVPVKQDISDKLDIQYQPQGNRSIKWKDFFGGNLAVIERICRENMEKVGYA